MTHAQMETLFTRVFDRMVEAGWIHHYTFTTGKGFRPAWTVTGTARASRFSFIIKGCGLDEGDKSALIFDKLAHGERLPDGFSVAGDIPEDVTRDWRDGVAELGLRGDEDGLLGMVHIILGWQPDSETPIEVGFR